MTRGAGAALAAASAVYGVLIVGLAARAGANYEEVVPYVLTALDIRDTRPSRVSDGATPRFVTSEYLPRLAFEPSAGRRLPLLNQLYMTDHLSYGGVALAALGMDGLWAARLWHALFGLAVLWLLYDIAILLGLGTRGALLTVAIAATSLQVATCYAVARFDESLPSFGTVGVLWAALRYQRDRRQRWVWVGVLAAALAITGKVTALWSLAGLAVAGALAGWRPPPARALALPALAALPLFAPMIGFAVAGPATGGEIERRLAFLGNLFTVDVLGGTAANLVAYLGSWGGIISVLIRGAEARPPNLFGRVLVCAALVWLCARVAAPGPLPRRRRLETHMLAFLGVIFLLVTLFFREHRDYQFLLLVPLHALALAAFLDWCARRFLDRRLPAWAAGVLVGALAVGANLWEQRGLHLDLGHPRNAMTVLDLQRASAAWLRERGALRPIVVTFYAVGTYELLSDGAVRPVYIFPLLRETKDASFVPDPAATWRALLADGGDEPRYAVLPLGENPVEDRHFDEAAIRAALLDVAEGERVAVFSAPRGDPLLEVWQVRTRPSVPAGSAGGRRQEPAAAAPALVARRASTSTTRSAARPSHSGGQRGAGRSPSRTRSISARTRSGRVPMTRFVPSLTVAGRSVLSRSVRHGTPRKVVSSCTPPESVRTSAARCCSASMST
jgi:hypothetical protein